MSVVREERKVVTVLFCDLVGFTSRSEDADPEDVAAVLRGYHGHVGSELERFGGTVEKFIGDAVMALFGAPIAHEDDPERAVRAALAIRDWAEEEGELEVRVGITTGEALVSLDARPDSGQGMASGDVVNTAARLQAAAAVNGILVDQTTYRATERAIVFEEAEPVEAKGKREPVPVFRALETRARYGVDITADEESPLVGRARELDLLVDALARARNEREPQLITLVGVPGIGKSRLVYELSRAVDEDEELIAWRQGRSLPYGEGVTFWSLGEMAKAQAGILESDSAEVATQKLEHAVHAVIDDESESEWVLRQLRPLVGLAAGDDLAGDRRSEAFAAWRRFFEAIADESPLVLVFEDLQWADDGVLDFIDHMMEWSSGLPLLIVATARPELLERRPGWGGGKLNAATTQLGALSETDTARLLAALLEQAVLPAETQATLLARAGGNPLYAQEFVRMLTDRGLLRRDGGTLTLAANGDLPLPESIQGIIAARLDVLSLDEKELIQDASVLGKVVWTGALETIAKRPRASVEECLHALRRKDFLRHERRSAVAGETQFTFLHLLTRDVAYGQIPRVNRADKHRSAAEWLESLPADRAEDRAEMIAHHYLAALELARSAGQETSELLERARRALAEAGERALTLNAFAQAIQFYTAAVGLTTTAGPERAHMLYRLMTAKMYGGGAEIKEFEEARDALLGCGQRELAAEVAVMAAVMQTNRGEQDVAWEQVGWAEKLIDDATASRSKAFVLQWLALSYSLAGKPEEALEYGGAAIELAESLGLDDILANALSTRGITYLGLGDPRTLEDQRRSVEIARAANSVDVMRSLGNLASSLLDLRADRRGAGDPRGGRDGGSALRKHVVPRLARTGTCYLHVLRRSLGRGSDSDRRPDRGHRAGRPHELHGVGQSLRASAHPPGARRRRRSGRRRGTLARHRADREKPPAAAPGACRPGRRPGGDPQPGRSLHVGRRAVRELAGTSDPGVRLLADRGRLRARSARAWGRARRGARADQGPLAVGRGRTRLRFRGLHDCSRHPHRDGKQTGRGLRAPAVGQ